MTERTDGGQEEGRAGRVLSEDEITDWEKWVIRIDPIIDRQPPELRSMHGTVSALIVTIRQLQAQARAREELLARKGDEWRAALNKQWPVLMEVEAAARFVSRDWEDGKSTTNTRSAEIAHEALLDAIMKLDAAYGAPRDIARAPSTPYGAPGGGAEDA